MNRYPGCRRHSGRRGQPDARLLQNRPLRPGQRPAAGLAGGFRLEVLDARARPARRLPGLGEPHRAPRGRPRPGAECPGWARAGGDVLATVVLGAVLFLVPVYLQAIQGFSTLQTGLALLPQDVVMEA